MSNKVRVYEVAKDLRMETNQLLALLKTLGVHDVRNHMSALAPEAVERVKRHLDKESGEKPVEVRIKPTVVKRRARRVVPAAGSGSSPTASAAPQSSPQAAEAPETRAPRAAGVVVRRAPAAAGVSEPARTKAPEAPQPAPKVAAEPLSVPASSEPAAAAKPAPRPVTPEPAAALPAAAEAPAADAPAAAARDEVAPQRKVAQPEAPALPEPSPPASAPTAQAQPVAAQEPESPALERHPEVAPAKVAEASQPAGPAAMRAEDVPPPAPPAPSPAQESRPRSQPRPAAHPRATGTTAAKPESAPAASAPARPAAPAAPAAPARPSSPPKTGIDVWEGRPGVPMPQQPRGPQPRRSVYDAKAGGGPRGPGGRPGPAMRGRGPGGRRGFGPPHGKRGTGQILTQERSAHKKVVKIEGSVTLSQLAGSMALKATQLLRKLMQLGMSGIHINSTLDADTAKIVANEFGWEVENVEVSEEAALAAARGMEDASTETAEATNLVPRPPVVTVMGHVDHGKTSLLDRIRKANVVQGEAGGITQHIGAYSVETSHGTITFLDTPGHAAFSAMRARGAQCTDIVVLVVAADDGVMPQTKEAISHARSANVPIVVAVNKIDKEDAQPERVRRELSEVGLVPEEWGGDTLFTEVSAATGDGVENLLEQILLQADVLELAADPSLPAEGVVVEAKLDRGMGALATVLVTNGTLRRGEAVLAGQAFGKIRAMQDHRGKNLQTAGPSTPVAIIGLDDVPRAGDPVHAVKDAKKAQEIASQRKSKSKEVAGKRQRLSMEDILSQLGQSQALELKLIIKSDVQGSAEALSHALDELSTQKVKCVVVHSGVGGITETDVNLAVAAGAIIVGFNVKPAGKAAQLAQQEGVEIRNYSIIYNVVDDVKAAMEGLLAPTLVEEPLGKAEVLQVFRISKAGTIAGCMVQDGMLRRGAGVRVRRGKDIVHEGKIGTLKRFKDDVREVKSGFECGVGVEDFGGVEVGDLLEVFEMKAVKQTL